MRSIRLSLILYFLLLLGTALGGVSYFCYQSTEKALEDKAASTTKLWLAQYNDNCAREHAEFDRDLLARAKALAKKLEGKTIWHFHTYESLNWLSGIHPLNSYIQIPFWLAASYPPLKDKIHRIRPPDFRILPGDFDDMMPLIEDGEYFQLISSKGYPLKRSDNLQAWMTVSEETRQKSSWQGLHDNVTIARFNPDTDNVENITVRRVALKTYMGRLQRGLVVLSLRPPGFFKGPGKGDGFPGFFKGKGGDGHYPPILLFASDTTFRDQKLADLKAKLDRDLDQLQDDLHVALADLGTRMMWIGLGTFVALVVGGYLLVWIGLAPLQRLSEAVRQVSAKDFRLPVNQAQLPRELQPIAGRLAETLAELKRVFTREKQAAAEISHELRTPLATLLTTIEVGLNKPRTQEQYREILEDCRASAHHMNHLVERLLTLARLDAGAAALRPCQVDLAHLAEQCANLVRPLAQARELDLQVQTTGPAVLHADPDKLREVLNNLLSNAIDYNRPHGSVQLTVARQNGHLTVEVSDTGIGIPAEAQPHIFERFFRADPSRHSEGVHTGLGLSIVKGYVDLMGGSIGVESSPAGSTFRVQFPAP